MKRNEPVEIEIGWVDRLELLDGFAVFVRRSEGSGVGEARESVLADGDRNDGVETQEREVGLVVPAKSFVREMGMDQA